MVPTQDIPFNTNQQMGLLKTLSIAAVNLHGKTLTVRPELREQVEDELLTNLLTLQAVIGSLISQFGGEQ